MLANFSLHNIGKSDWSVVWVSMMSNNTVTKGVIDFFFFSSFSFSDKRKVSLARVAVYYRSSI